MKNETMTYEKYHDLLSASGVVVLGNPTLIFGKPTIFKDKEIVLFEHCDYCGARAVLKKGLQDRYYCSQCGAPV